MSQTMQVSHLDHFVLTVKDIDATVDFYTSVMGMNRVTFKQNRTALTYGEQKINLHQLGNEFEPKAKHVQSGSADLCFIIHTSIKGAVEHLNDLGIDIIKGPVNRTGATGNIESIYFRDPDGNLIEVSNYQN